MDKSSETKISKHYKWTTYLYKNDTLQQMWSYKSSGKFYLQFTWKHEGQNTNNKPQIPPYDMTKQETGFRFSIFYWSEVTMKIIFTDGWQMFRKIKIFTF